MKVLTSIIALAAIMVGLGMVVLSVFSEREDTFMLFIIGAVVAQSGYSLRHDMRLDALEGK